MVSREDSYVCSAVKYKNINFELRLKSWTDYLRSGKNSTTDVVSICFAIERFIKINTFHMSAVPMNMFDKFYRALGPPDTRCGESCSS